MTTPLTTERIAELRALWTRELRMAKGSEPWDQMVYEELNLQLRQNALALFNAAEELARFCDTVQLAKLYDVNAEAIEEALHCHNFLVGKEVLERALAKLDERDWDMIPEIGQPMSGENCKSLYRGNANELRRFAGLSRTLSPTDTKQER